MPDVLALPALGADTGTGYAAHDCGFRSAHIVPVETGDREGLQDVILDTNVFKYLIHDDSL